jgi:hypothetical protein
MAAQVQRVREYNPGGRQADPREQRWATTTRCDWLAAQSGFRSVPRATPMPASGRGPSAGGWQLASPLRWPADRPEARRRASRLTRASRRRKGVPGANDAVWANQASAPSLPQPDPDVLADTRTSAFPAPDELAWAAQSRTVACHRGHSAQARLTQPLAKRRKEPPRRSASSIATVQPGDLRNANMTTKAQRAQRRGKDQSASRGLGPG